MSTTFDLAVFAIKPLFIIQIETIAKVRGLSKLDVFLEIKFMSLRW